MKAQRRPYQSSNDTGILRAESPKKPFEAKALTQKEVCKLALAFLERRIVLLQYEKGMEDNPHQAGMLRKFLEENYIVNPEKACMLYYTEPKDQNGYSLGGVEIFLIEDVRKAAGIADEVRNMLNNGEWLRNYSV